MPEFQLTDLNRILFGLAPPVFLIEVAIRTTLTYVLLVLAMRLLGRRVADNSVATAGHRKLG